MLNAFLMRDAEQPGAKLFVLLQTADVPHGVDKRLLHNIQAGLFVMNEFKNIDVKRQLVAAEKSVPRIRFPGSGILNGQLFVVGHH